MSRAALAGVVVAALLCVALIEVFVSACGSEERAPKTRYGKPAVSLADR